MKKNDVFVDRSWWSRGCRGVVPWLLRYWHPDTCTALAARLNSADADNMSWMPRTGRAHQPTWSLPDMPGTQDCPWTESSWCPYWCGYDDSWHFLQHVLLHWIVAALHNTSVHIFQMNLVCMIIFRCLYYLATLHSTNWSCTNSTD